MPAIDEPQNARSRRTRDAIQAAALDLLKTSGARAVTLAEVAHRAGCSRRALYLHFPSRAALLGSLVTYVDEVEGFTADARLVEEAPDARAAIRAFGAFLGRYHPRIASIVSAVSRERYTDADAAHTWDLAMAQWRSGCERLVDRLVAEGVLHERFETPRQAVDLLWAMMSIDVLQRLVDDCGWTGEAYGRHLGAILEGALCRPA